MTYARARLWLGIANVGFWVALSAYGLATLLPARLFSPLEPLWQSPFRGLPAVLGLYIALSFPFDLLGGWLLPRWFGRPALPFLAFLARWLYGALAQAALWFVIGLAFWHAWRFGMRFGPAWIVPIELGVAFGGMLLLLLFQYPLARFVGGLPPVAADLEPHRRQLTAWGIPAPEITVVENRDSGFTGGFDAGLGPQRVLLPASWLRELPVEIVAVQIARRVGALETGAQRRGILLALAFNLLGFWLALQLPNAVLATAQGLVTVAFGMTLWSFCGLLVLPSLSRPAVFAIDRYLVEKGVPRPVLERACAALDRLQDDEPARPPLVETIFHPIPAVSRRIERMASGKKAGGAWNAARTALLLSWAGLSLLSRAVHCNIGRPELWVLFPTD
jgi:hypothetical protein